MGPLEGGKILRGTRNSSMPRNPKEIALLPTLDRRRSGDRPYGRKRGRSWIGSRESKNRPAIFDDCGAARKTRDRMTGPGFICRAEFWARDYSANSILQFDSLNRLSRWSGR